MTTFTTEDRIQASSSLELGIKPYITVKLRTSYGTQFIYPVDDQAKTFCKLLGQTTFTPYNIKCIKELGYTIQVESTEPKEL